MGREIIKVIPPAQKAPSSVSFREHIVFHTLRVLALISLWYLFSTSLNLCNKLLIGRNGVDGKGKFPAPLLMTGLEFLVQFIMCRLFLDLGLVDRSESSGEERTWAEYNRTLVPNGVSTGLDIGFSNLSLRTISLSFYTMCKSTTPMFLLLFAFLWKLESPSCALFGIMTVISTGIVFLVYGENKFSTIGFVLVMIASCLAGLRWTLTQLFLQGDKNPIEHRHRDQSPLELMEKLTPIMSAIVLLISACFEKWYRLPYSPYFSDHIASLNSLGVIILIGIVAFLMVWAEFKVIQETSALTFMVAGTCKEIVTVAAAVVFFEDEFGLINGMGLVILLMGVSLFNVHKYQKMKSAFKDDLPPAVSPKFSRLRELSSLRNENNSR